MTREEIIEFLEGMKKGISPWSDEVMNEICDTAISALSTEGEYIKKEDILEELEGTETFYRKRFEKYQDIDPQRANVARAVANVYKYLILFTSDLPTYSFPEREKGAWIIREDNTSFVKQIPRRWVECSCCGWSFSYDRIRDDFCSKCGADMRGGKNE